MSNHKRLIITLGLSAVLITTLLIGCSSEESKLKGDVEKLSEVEEENEEHDEYSISINTEKRGKELAEAIVRDNLADVELVKSIINTDIDNPKAINNADFYLYLNNNNKKESEKIIEKYGDIFSEKFSERESYLAITLYWNTPNHDSDGTIEKDYIQ